jgi:TonB family protein
MTRLIVITGLVLLLFLGCGPSPKPGDESSPPQGISIVTDAAQDSGGVVVDQQPVMIYEEPPVYPSRAQSMKVEGIVQILAHVDRLGEVDSVEVKKCSPHGYGFEKSASEAAFKYRFEPARSHGTPVDCWVTYDVDFVLDR